MTYHSDRVTQGPHFRHDRALKLVQNRTSSQAARVTAALTELGIPARLVMPTGAVCAVFEELVGAAVGLLECRRVRERLEGEVRVVEGMAEERAKVEGEGEDGGLDGVKEEEDDDDDEKEAGETADVTMEDGEDVERSGVQSSVNSPAPDGDEDEGEEDVGGEGGGAVVAAVTAEDGVNGEEQTRKRSASVLSNASGQANKRSRK